MIIDITFHVSSNNCSDSNCRRLHCFTAQKMKFSIKDFFSKCDQIRRFLQIRSHLLKKSLMENFIFLYIVSHSFDATMQAMKK